MIALTEFRYHTTGSVLNGTIVRYNFLNEGLPSMHWFYLTKGALTVKFKLWFDTAVPLSTELVQPKTKTFYQNFTTVVG